MALRHGAGRAEKPGVREHRTEGGESRIRDLYIWIDGDA